MNVEFRETFIKDLRDIKNKGLLRRIKEVVETAERARTLQGLSNLKRLKGGVDYYRIRIGDYRMGLIVEDNSIVFVRCLNRKDIYRYFP